MIEAPPVDHGTSKAIDACALICVATNDLGALAVVRGVTDTDDESVPIPAAFTARKLM